MAGEDGGATLPFSFLPLFIIVESNSKWRQFALRRGVLFLSVEPHFRRASSSTEANRKFQKVAPL